MLKATHHLTPIHFEPGAVIMQEGAFSDKFYVVTAGRAEVALKRPGAADVVVFRPAPGEYFGEIELMRDTESIATVRATADAPVDVVALDRQTFSELLDESPETKDAMAQIVDARTAENIASRGRRVS
jgi:CRP-like cAMP-binding protein